MVVMYSVDASSQMLYLEFVKRNIRLVLVYIDFSELRHCKFRLFSGDGQPRTAFS